MYIKTLYSIVYTTVYLLISGSVAESTFAGRELYSGFLVYGVITGGSGVEGPNKISMFTYFEMAFFCARSKALVYISTKLLCHLQWSK